MDVVAGEPWYESRQGQETALSGVLRRRDAQAGPGSRAALHYALEALEETIPVYAPDPAVLAPFVGREVVVQGKIVDLTDEGFGVELWVGSISLTP